MNHSITEVHVRKQGKRVMLQAFGRTGRGTKYIVGEREIPKQDSLDTADRSKLSPLLTEIIVERDAKE